MLDLMHYNRSANQVKKISEDLKMADETRVAAHRLFGEFRHLAKEPRQNDLAQADLLERMDALIKEVGSRP
jgi:hypothetical protein